VSLGDIAAMPELDGRGKSYAQWFMNQPGAPVGTPTRSGRIWARPAVRKFIETWEPGWHPSKGPRGTCDQGHTLEVRDDGTRIPCRICDGVRHDTDTARQSTATGMRALRARRTAETLEIPCDEEDGGCGAGPGELCSGPGLARGHLHLVRRQAYEQRQRDEIQQDEQGSGK
jgi:hypothetical protein